MDNFKDESVGHFGDAVKQSQRFTSLNIRGSSSPIIPQKESRQMRSWTSSQSRHFDLL